MHKGYSDSSLALPDIRLLAYNLIHLTSPGICIENRLKPEISFHFVCNMIMRHKVILSIVIHSSGLCQSFSICKGKGAGGISWAGQADLPVGCEHTDISDRLQ